MRYISELNLLKLPITFLTATLTLETQVLLFKKMELDEDTRVIRGPTKRGNIHYAVHFLKANKTEDIHYKRVIDQYLTSLRNNNTLVTGDQMLIFISNSYGDIERMANEFGHEYYHNNRSDRKAVLASFKKGEFVVLVTSSALGLRLDMPNIRCVIQIGFLSSVINFSQESGRAGRDGKKAHSLTITPVNKNRAECATKRISYEPNELNWVLFQQIDKDNMSRFIYTSQCRRLLLNNAFDNLVNQQCDASKGDKLCDLYANRQRITNERAQRENQKQALRLGNTIKLGELLDQLKNTCIWCVFVGNWDHIYAHSFNECTYQDLTDPSLRLGMRGQTSTYAEMKSWVFDIKRTIHNNRWIREGYACYSCFLPIIFCAEPGEPCQKWKFSTNDVKCEWRNIVIEFNVLMYNLHVTGRHDMHYETAIGTNHQLAKALVKTGIIHNTECIQGVI
jgi:superfamily II DNA helicase RecQ